MHTHSNKNIKKKYAENCNNLSVNILQISQFLETILHNFSANFTTLKYYFLKLKAAMAN